MSDPTSQPPFPSELAKKALENIHGRPPSFDDWFKYHAPQPEQVEQYDVINAAAKAFAGVVLAACPDCADRSTALREIRSARMWANAAIAIPRPKDPPFLSIPAVVKT